MPILAIFTCMLYGAGCLGTVIPPSIQVTGMGVLSGGLELVALYKLAQSWVSPAEAAVGAAVNQIFQL